MKAALAGRPALTASRCWAKLKRSTGGATSGADEGEAVAIMVAALGGDESAGWAQRLALTGRGAAPGDMKYWGSRPTVHPRPYHGKHYNAFARVNTEPAAGHRRAADSPGRGRAGGR